MDVTVAHLFSARAYDNTNTVDVTISNEINSIPTGDPATDLLRELLCSLRVYGSHGRDIQLLGQVFHRSLIVYNAIQACMEAFRTGDGLDWINLDRYTGAIPQLEK